MEIKKLNDEIYQMDYILCCLTAYRGIIETGRDCNQCAAARGCEYAPKPGEQIRYNCPHFVEPKKVACDSITCTNDSEKPNTSPDHIAEADKMKPFARGHENDKDIIFRSDMLDAFWKLDIELQLSQIDKIVDTIKGIRPAKIKNALPGPKLGKWINKDKRNNLYECSECGLITYSESVQNLKEFERFCSRCGARLEVEQ